VDVYEQVQLDKWRKSARLRQDVLHDLQTQGQPNEAQFLSTKRQINLAIYMSWRNVLGAKIVEHDLYLDRVSVEALVHLGGLDEVADI
jgi:hypothetical protein